MNAIGTEIDTHVGQLVDEMLADFALECTTCTGLICLDCAQGVRHTTCTRACPECATQDLDWDQSWEASQIVTELAGLHRLDAAIAQLPA